MKKIGIKSEANAEHSVKVDEKAKIMALKSMLW
jgi:hypothetical protein